VARGLRLAEAGRAWIALAALLAAGSVLGLFVPAASWDWQPELAFTEPWRLWTAAFVHWSERHLLANLAGCVVVGALGWVARAPVRITLAWALAWPLTHMALLLRPALVHYGGLSGVLHAGVAAAAAELLLAGRGRARWLAGAMLAGLLVKIVSEEPWGAVLQHPPDWDIAVAPLAHAAGAVAGLLLALALHRPQSRP